MIPTRQQASPPVRTPDIGSDLVGAEGHTKNRSPIIAGPVVGLG